MEVSRIQWRPNAFREGKRKILRVCLNRTYLRRPWDKTGKKWCSAKVSTSIVVEPRDLWIGAFWTKDSDDFKLYICLIPCLPIRFHVRLSWGGYLD